MHIYVGNIAYIISEADLEKLFGKFGKVEKVKIVKDDLSGQNAGWAFVTMENDDDAAKAVEALNLKNFRGKKLKVNKYRPKSKKGPKFGEWINY
ncbi:RNA recognition motif domain-containing protein [Fibrobacterota bacterium]